ncbi:hypothetical protein [Terriglobus sp. RCC_193]|uniref:hypothetical protein n=1 Tax=Terriglobus sp. RCC_193 TaxID=3239218 RepID=UPI003523726C
MAKNTIPMISGDEHDAFTRWRRFLHWRPGIRARVKRGYNKRRRRQSKLELRSTEAERCLPPPPAPAAISRQDA